MRADHAAPIPRLDDGAAPSVLAISGDSGIGKTRLVRHPPRPTVLLAVAYRPRQLRGRLRRLIAGAVQHGTATLVEPGPLTATEAAALLGPDVDETRRRRVYEASGATRSTCRRSPGST